jgi:hypothetical protein
MDALPKSICPENRMDKGSPGSPWRGKHGRGFYWERWRFAGGQALDWIE